MEQRTPDDGTDWRRNHLNKRMGLTNAKLKETMAERNLWVDHVTIWRWVVCPSFNFQGLSGADL
jgi:hypothetical protein